MLFVDFTEFPPNFSGDCWLATLPLIPDDAIFSIVEKFSEVGYATNQSLFCMCLY